MLTEFRAVQIDQPMVLPVFLLWRICLNVSAVAGELLL